jgi:hypothetical protein
MLIMRFIHIHLAFMVFAESPFAKHYSASCTQCTRHLSPAVFNKSCTYRILRQLCIMKLVQVD